MTTLKVQRRNMETKAKKLRREGYVTGNLLAKKSRVRFHCRLKSRRQKESKESA